MKEDDEEYIKDFLSIVKSIYQIYGFEDMDLGKAGNVLKTLIVKTFLQFDVSETQMEIFIKVIKMEYLANKKVNDEMDEETAAEYDLLKN